MRSQKIFICHLEIKMAKGVQDADPGGSLICFKRQLMGGGGGGLFSFMEILDITRIERRIKSEVLS